MLQSCLSKWKANFLSLAEQITLKKSVLNTVPVYNIQTNLLSNSLCKSIDKISKDFIWGTREDGKGTDFIACNDLYKPKNNTAYESVPIDEGRVGYGQ